MGGEWFRALGFFLVLALLGGVAYALFPSLLGVAAGPEAEILSLVKGEEREGLRLDVLPDAPRLVASRAHFDRVTVTVDPGARTAEAVATLDFDGKLGNTTVSSLGYEKLRFRHVDGRWEVEGSFAPRLSAIARALELRRRALERGEGGARLTGDGGAEPSAELRELLSVKDRRVSARAWYVRSEREEVVVTEDGVVEGALPDRPVHDAATRRLTLIRGEDGEFFFPRGLL